MKAEQENEYIILLVNEPIPEYGVPEYKGTSINVAIKDYYSFTTNREKVAVLKWITAQPQFTEMKRFTEGENKIFTLNESEYDDILKTGETPKNLQIALKFVKNKFDVFLLSNPSNTKSADFIIRQKGKLFYVEGKTLNGKNSLNHLIEKGGLQSNRIAINIVGTTVTNYIKDTIKKSFEQNNNLTQLYLFKGQRCIIIDRDAIYSKDFEKIFTRLWNRRK
ncbi:MAG: hypothetical protein MJ211_15625 [Bacteroidales bacterium]|nr:hypothetical protein [Bacteroidales bacterium]